MPCQVGHLCWWGLQRQRHAGWRPQQPQPRKLIDQAGCQLVAQTDLANQCLHLLAHWLMMPFAHLHDPVTSLTSAADFCHVKRGHFKEEGPQSLVPQETHYNKGTGRFLSFWDNKFMGIVRWFSLVQQLRDAVLTPHRAAWHSAWWPSCLRADYSRSSCNPHVHQQTWKRKYCH